MKIQIKNRFDGTVIFETDAETIGDAVKAAIAAKSDLSRANLSGEHLERALSQRTILPEGDLIGWKKLQGGVICKLRIPAKAGRVGGLIGRKCRVEFAIVLEGDGQSRHDSAVTYKKGKRIKPDKFDPNPLVECAGGIHFFITHAEAEAY
jgi:hypothetical protein